MASPAVPTEEEELEQFYERWLLNQERFMEELQSFTNTSVQERVVQPLVAVVLGHYRQLFRARRAAARLHVTAVLSPPWLTPFEKSVTWIGGWRPRTLLRIAATALAATLRDDQRREMERLQAETIEQEDGLSRQMQSVQDAVVDGRVVDLARLQGRLRNGEVDRASACLDLVMAWESSALELVLEKADCLRLATLRSVVKMLGSVQAASFLAATALWHLQVRRLGKRQQQRNVLGRSRAQ
ncbi:unnamed protein product [Victoria cruziana]